MLLKKLFDHLILTFYKRLQIRVGNIFFIQIVVFFPYKNIINGKKNFIRKLRRNISVVYNCMIFINF